MKIIKQGLSKEELDAKLKATKRFQCPTCNCIFEADNDEYSCEDEHCYVTYYCECPNCGKSAFEVNSKLR